MDDEDARLHLDFYSWCAGRVGLRLMAQMLGRAADLTAAVSRARGQHLEGAATRSV